ncbi:MAG: DoxX family membrane protein [Desulfovibrio sp.]|nr:DoxX family membrane protein [Desulfovibrio sp.]
MNIQLRKAVRFLNPWLALCFRIYLGGLFIYASIYKINYPAEFAETIASYQIIPYYMVNIMAVVLPWMELISGTLLLAGIRTRAATAALGGLLVLFTLAIIWVLFQGVPIGCGCFHTIEDPISWLTLARDLLWLAMAAHVFGYDRYFHLEEHFRMRIREAACDPS